MGKKVAICGATKLTGRCEKIFEVKGDNNPIIFICPDCEHNMNMGIMKVVHENTGKLRGNFSNMERNFRH